MLLSTEVCWRCLPQNSAFLVVFRSPVSPSSHKQMHKSEQEQVEVFDPPLYFVFEPSNSFLVSTVFGSGNFLSLKWSAHLSLSSSSTLLFSLQVFSHVHHPW